MEMRLLLHSSVNHSRVYYKLDQPHDVLALPIFKQEESNLPPDSENKILPFQYVLCAATSPAIKLHDETLTYLNQGQSYEIRMLDNRKMGELPELTGKMVKYTEHQQLEGWRWNRPGDRILDLGELPQPGLSWTWEYQPGELREARQGSPRNKLILPDPGDRLGVGGTRTSHTGLYFLSLSPPMEDIPMSVGMIDPRANPTQLNTVEYLWDLSKRTSVFIQVHCISTEFTMRKHGGEKGVPFRVQIDTFKENENGEYTEHLHSASCQIKVFKPKGADRKQKTDREKMEKRTPQEKEKYQPSYDTTILTENLLPTATPQEAQQWLLRNRFSSFCRLFNNFSGTDLLKLTREDVIQICGPADGIRLFNAVKGRVVRPRLTIYVCQESQQTREQQKHENGDAAGGTFFGEPLGEQSGARGSLPGALYHAIYLEELTAAELTEKIAQLFSISPQQISQIYKQGPTGIHVLVCDEVRGGRSVAR
ncbi:UNVERIFIED_CONTAM: hypothetical protein FKN15_064767 [Acipenser sinensis]